MAQVRQRPTSYMGTFSSARQYLLHAFATTESATIRKRVLRYLISNECHECSGRRLRREALSVTFAGLDITALSRLSLDRLMHLLDPYAHGGGQSASTVEHPEKVWSSRASHRKQSRDRRCCASSDWNT